MNKTVQVNLANGVTLLAKLKHKDRGIVILSNPLMIQRYLTDDGESFSMMSYTPYQLDESLEISMNNVVALVEINSPKITEIYTDYLKSFAMSLEPLPVVEQEEGQAELEPQRTLH